MSIGNTVEAVIGATLAPSFRKAFNEADKTTTRLGESVKKLSATAASSKGLNQLKGQVTGARGELAKTSRALESVNKRIDSGEQQTDELVNAWIKAETQFEQSKNKLNGLERELSSATRKSKQFDDNTDKLTSSQKRLETQLGKTKAAQDRYNATMTRSNQLKTKSGNLAMASAGAGVAAYGIGRAVAAPIREGMEIEQSISKVNAIATQKGSFATLGEAQDALAVKIRQLGASTAFTSSEVAEGAKFLTMAGFDIEKTIGALPATLSLSKAGDLDLGSTADIMSNIMTPFKIGAERTEEVADILTAVVTTSNTDIRMLGESMKYVAPIAKTYGLTMADTAGMVGILGNSGIQASQAGTVMRSMLLKLAAPLPKAKKLFDELGISLTTAAGEMRKPEEIMADLANGMSNANFSTSKQLEGLKNAFGEEAMSGVAVMMEEAEQNGEKGSEALQKYLKSVRDVRDGERGLTASVAAKQLDNLAGDFTILGSAISGSFDTAYQSIRPMLRTVVKGITTVVSGLNEFAKRNPFVAKTVMMVAVAAGTLTAALAVGLAVAAAYTFAQSHLLRVNAALALSLGKTTASTSLLSTVMMTGSAVSKKFAASMAFASASVRGFTIAGAKAKLVGIGTSLVGMATTAVTSAAGIGAALSTAGASLAGLGSAATAFMVSNPIGWIIGAVAAVGFAVYKYWEPIKAFASGVWEPVSTTLGEVADNLSPVLDLFGAVAGAVGSVIGAIGGLFSPVDSTADSLGKAKDAGIGFGKIISFMLTPLKAAAWVIGKVASAAAWLVEALVPVATGVIGVIGSIGGILFDAVALPFKLAYSVISGIATGIGMLWDGLVWVVSGIGSALWSVITAPFRLAYNTVVGVVDLIGGIWSGITDIFGSIGNVVYDAITYPFRKAWETISSIGETISDAWNWLWGDDDEDKKVTVTKVGSTIDEQRKDSNVVPFSAPKKKDNEILQPVSNSKVYDFEAAKEKAINAGTSPALSSRGGTTQRIEKVEINVSGAGDPELVAQRVYQRQQEEMFRIEREMNY